MKLFFLLIILTVTFSTVNGQSHLESVSKKYKHLQKNTLSTTWKLPTKEQKETFDILGLEYFGEYTVTNTSEDDSILRIISIKNLHSCFLHRTHPG